MSSSTNSPAPVPIFYRTQALTSGVEIFYRESGDRKTQPTLLLLHGYPTSSHMFRDLFPLLNRSFHVIAPDLPLFGQTKVPAGYRATFDNIATSIGEFVDAQQLQRFSLYIFDYGAPVGLKLALAHPERVQAVVSQNGNAYEEGLGDAWASIRTLWKDNSAANRSAIEFLTTPAGFPYQYAVGFADPSRVSLDGQTLDAHFLARPGQTAIQLDLFFDYQNNVKQYPAFQQWFRDSQVPLLAVWGAGDPFFVPAGAAAFKRDLPKAEVVMLEGAGHFALETCAWEIAEHIRRFLSAHVTPSA